MIKKVVKVDSDTVYFQDGFQLYSYHEQECCESHYLSFGDLTIDDFKDLEFDLSDENFFKRIDDYGIELIPLKGHSIKVPGYGSNNGYYSSNIDLVLFGKDVLIHYDVSDCQILSE